MAIVLTMPCRAAKRGVKLTAGLAHLQPEGRAALGTQRCTAASASAFESPAVLVAAYRHRAARLAFAMTDLVDAGVASGKTETDARNSVGIELVRASMAHCMLIVLDRFVSGVAKTPAGSAEHTVLTKLLKLFALFYLEQDLGEFMEDGYLSPQQAAWTRQGVRRLLKELVDNALGLVDAFDFTDHSLNSSLGRYDGNW